MPDPKNPNYVDGYGDLGDPEAMLYYKLNLAMTFRDQQLDNPNCSAGTLNSIIQNIGLLRAQITSLHDTEITLKPPSHADINSIKALTTQVEALTQSSADMAAGLALLDQVATATATLASK